jgi:signal transduction histidine kinase
LQIKLSIKFKILFLFTFTLLAATGLNLLFMSRIVRENYIEALNAELLAQANNLKSQLTRITDLGISVKDVDGFDRICLDLVKKNKSLQSAMVINADGAILYHSDPGYLGKHINNDEMIQALFAKQPKFLGSSKNGRDIYYAITPYHEDNKYSKYSVVVSCNADITDSKVLALIGRCNIFFLSTFGLASLLLLISLTHILTKPLDIILETIRSVSKNKTLQQHIEVNSDDEIGQIAAAFNQMTDDLQKSTTSLESLNKEIKFRKTAEIEAQTARLEAEAANKMKSIFLANMSHEIRTPMNALMGFSEILCEENLNHDQKKYVHIIFDNARSLLRLMNDILDFSRIEAGKLHLEKIDCSPSQILEDVLATLSPLAENKGLEFKLYLSPSLPRTIYTDPSRLRQCILNLASNAIKFTNQGHVYMRALASESDTQHTLHIVIEDTGIGIDKEKTRVMFDAFSQIDSSLSRCHGGTGLGLAITKQLIELMDGQIFVVSDKGAGTVFTITLPLQTPATLQIAPIAENIVL